MRIAIWYFQHRQILRKIVLALILAIDGVLVIYSGFGAGRELFYSDKRRQQEFELLKTSIPSAVSRTVSRPVDLQLRGVELLRSGVVTDIVARVQNPNAQWYARFAYTIGVGEMIERFEDGFLLPQEERPFVRTLRSAGGGTIVFNIENLEWRRISPKEIPDFAVWRDERLNFEVKNPRFTPAVLQGSSGSASRANFTLTNRTAFGYSSGKFLVLLFQGSRLQGVQGLTVDNFRSGETRDLELTWIDRIGAVSDIEVVPAIDILDEDAYLKPEGIFTKSGHE